MEEILPPQTEDGAGFERTRVPQFTIFLENRVGRLNAVVRLLEEHVGKINALSIEESADSALVRVICSSADDGRTALNAPDSRSARPTSWPSNCPKTAASRSCPSVPHYYRPRSTFIMPIHCCSVPVDRRIALYVDDPTLAAQILIRKGFILIGESDLIA